MSTEPPTHFSIAPPTRVRTAPPDVDAVCVLYERALLVDDVDPDDDLYELGGHSLIAAQLVAEVQKRYGVPVSLADFLAEPTPRALARLAATAPDPT